MHFAPGLYRLHRPPDSGRGGEAGSWGLRPHRRVQCGPDGGAMPCLSPQAGGHGHARAGGAAGPAAGEPAGGGPVRQGRPAGCCHHGGGGYGDHRRGGHGGSGAHPGCHTKGKADWPCQQRNPGMRRRAGDGCGGPVWGGDHPGGLGTLCHFPVPGWLPGPGAGPALDPYLLRWPLLRQKAGGAPVCDPGGRPVPSQLAHGCQDYHRLRHPDEQGTGAH